MLKKIIDKSYLAFKKIRLNRFVGIDNELMDLFKVRKEQRKIVNTAKYNKEEPNEDDIGPLSDYPQRIRVCLSL